MEESEPVLYIFMRSDISSLNGGKGMAQAAHAANIFDSFVINKGLTPQEMNRYNKWQSQGNGFGKTIVLAVNNENQLKDIISELESYGIICGMVNDSSFPVYDGDAKLYANVNTCGFCFIDRMEVYEIGDDNILGDDIICATNLNLYGSDVK